MGNISVTEAAPDKAGLAASERFIDDLQMIQYSRAYVGEKKQLQALCKHLYDARYYENLDNELVARLYL